MLAHLSGTICLKHSATLILPPLLKPPSKCTCLIIISKLFFFFLFSFYSSAYPLVRRSVCVCLCVRACVRACARACVRVCVCVVSVIVKRPVLSPCSRNPLYYYYLKPELALIGCKYEQSDFSSFSLLLIFFPGCPQEICVTKR